MRALDVPARVVTGYQGGEINPIDHFLEVRQRDAHAWAEVWIAGAGWTRVDPTAAVAPERIERGAAEALTGVVGFAASDSWVATLLRNTRFNWDAVGNAWNQWILAYNADRQSGLFSGLGIERIDWQTLTIALIVSFSAVLAIIGATTLFRRVKVDPVVRQYERACATIARAVRPGNGPVPARAMSEGPRAYLARVDSRLPETMRARAHAMVVLYEELRYGRPLDETQQRVLRARFRQSVAALHDT